jgi:hemoglobin
MPSTAKKSGRTLYERLGGYDAVATIVDDLLARMRADPAFARFGGGRSLDSVRRGRELLVGQMCALAGGPCIYTGRGMKTAHAGLGINAHEWELALQHTSNALDHFKVLAKERKEFIDLFERYKGEIVEG